MRGATILVVAGLLATSLRGDSGKFVGKYIRKGAVMFIKPATEDQYTLTVSANYQGNVCLVDSRPAKVQKQEATFFDKENKECQLHVHFVGNGASLQHHGDCQCGLNVSLDGIYSKQNSPAKQAVPGGLTP